MHPSAAELQVEVHKLGNRYVAVTKDDAGREVLRNEFQYASTYLTYLGPPWLVDQSRLVPEEQGRLGRVLNGDEAQAQVSLQGWQLFQYLFGDGRALRRYLAAARRKQAAERRSTAGAAQPAAMQAAATAAGVSHLTLLFSPGAASLGRLPWEYLFDGKQFPCLEGRLMISRRPLDVAPVTTKATGGPLRLLLVVAAPTDQVALDTDLELGIVQDAVAPLLRQGSLVMQLLPEPTPGALLEMLRDQRYDVVHYVGHGAYHLPQHQGYLCFEDDLGRSAMVSGNQLPRFVGAGHPPNLFIVAACQNAQVGIFDAVLSVANDLLHHGLPRILSLPSPLDPVSAREFYRALFRSLVEGESVLSALRQGRWALRDADAGRHNEGPGNREQRLDWGLPILMQRTPPQALRLPPAQATVESNPETGSSPDLAPTLLSAHRRKLQSVRKALAAEAHVFYILGSDGVGKGTFVSYLLDHLGTKPSATLRVNCREMPEPLSTLALIADFWRGDAARVDLQTDGSAGGSAAARMDGLQAAEQLLDSHQQPRQRALEAQALMAPKRLLFVFENLDAWFLPGETGSGTLENDLLREVLVGLMSHPGRARFLFSGSRRWEALNEIPATDQREIRLPLLSERYALQLLQQLPALRTAAATPAQRQEIYRFAGGHPLILRYIDRWLSFGNNLSELADIAPNTRARTEDWLAELTRRLLDQLDPGAYQALRTLSILDLPFDARRVADLTRVTEEYARPLIAGWAHLGLVVPSAHPVRGMDAYTLAPAVRRCLLQALSPSEIATLHRRAADTYGAPYFNAAKRQVLARTITTWSDDRIGWLARDANGILGLQLRQETDPADKRATVEEALAWQSHLLQAGERDAAAQIAQALAPELNRQGQQDLSHELLEQSLPAPQGRDAGQKLDTLTNLRIDEGPLTEALRTYQELYRSLDPATDVVQRTYVMLRAGHVHQRLGNLEAAITHYQTALQIIRRREEHHAVADLTSEEAMTGPPLASNQTAAAEAQPAPTPASEGTPSATPEELTQDVVLTAEAECLAHLATAYRLTGALREALVHSQAAKEHYQALGEARGEAELAHEQGLILKAMARTDSALERFVVGLRICRRLGDQQCVAANLTEIGQLFDAMGKTDMAIQVIEEAIEHYAYLKSPEHGKVLSLLEALYAKQKRLSEAITRFQTSKRTAK